MNVTKDIQEKANEKKILIRPYNVIYKLIDDVKKEINNKLPQVDAEEVIGMNDKIQKKVMRHHCRFIFIVSS